MTPPIKVGTKKEIADIYSKKYPKWADYTLAKKMAEERKDYFKNLESARSAIRSVRSAMGEAKRKYATDPKPLTHNTNNFTPPKDEINGAAKILILDIETAPSVAYVWRMWKQNIQPNQIETDWFILTWAAKWLFEDKVYSGSVTPKESIVQNDKRMLGGIWQLLNEADIVIAHNGKKFDIRKLNTRFILNNLEPPLPYQVIDTLETLRRSMDFSHNRLDYVNQLLNLPRKIGNEGMPLWIKCIKGDKEALKVMLDYNIGDVRILEDTYLRILAWIKPHPNIGLFILDGVNRCPSCGSSDLRSEGKMYYTTANKFEMFRCNNCKSTGRKRLGATTVNEKRHLLTSLPR